MNKYKDIEKEEAPKKEKKTGFKSLMSGQFLNRDQAVQGLPFILFLSLLGIFYIANGYQAEKLIRQIYKTNNELKELRSEYITTKSDLMYISKQSQLARATYELGLKELTSPPKKIVLTEDEMEDYRDE
ncbi:MAG: hypothetical protein CMP59_01090 [Flavobacteriales bacterium]|nr:hypothetical protein [Flavobacteriales bacterium]|tara:strand:- start:60 stop:446 length:387 start_codon:yes stop_codon:yes gene_type:complete